MTPEDITALTQILKVRSGLNLSAEKAYLIESRLSPVARRRGFDGLDALLAAVRNGAAEPLLAEVTDAMTTNESFFFRDKTPFEQFEQVMLPALLETRATARRLRIWCAAASTGQEPYSLAILLAENAARLKGWRVEIIGTDISARVLERAREGLYTQFEVQRGLPIKRLMTHFTKDGDDWRLKEDVRRMVTFREFNLLDSYTPLGTFDIVFCRNVLIYFDRATKADVLTRLNQTMSPDGFLVLGAAETVLGITESFAAETGSRGLYRPAPAERGAVAVAG